MQEHAKMSTATDSMPERLPIRCHAQCQIECQMEWCNAPQIVIKISEIEYLDIEELCQNYLPNRISQIHRKTCIWDVIQLMPEPMPDRMPDRV